MMAEWLRRHLEDRGLWDADGISRAARGRRCRTCRCYVLAGLDANRCALPVAVDPDPLSPVGEAAALIAGRTTYALRFLSDRLEIDTRSRFEIAGDAGADRAGVLRRRDVLASHVCGEVSLGTLDRLGAATRLASPVARILDDYPPF